MNDFICMNIFKLTTASTTTTIELRTEQTGVGANGEGEKERNQIKTGQRTANYTHVHSNTRYIWSAHTGEFSWLKADSGNIQMTIIVHSHMKGTHTPPNIHTYREWIVQPSRHISQMFEYSALLIYLWLSS